MLKIRRLFTTGATMLIKPFNHHQCSGQQELASESDARRVPWNGGPKGLSTGSPPFPLAIFSPLSQTESLFTLIQKKNNLIRGFWWCIREFDDNVRKFGYNITIFSVLPSRLNG